MENVLAAFIIIFLILFGMLTLSENVLSSQMMIQESWQEAQTMHSEQARTNLLPLDAYTTHMGTVVVLTLRNTGTEPISEFAAWDAFLEYSDAGALYRTVWLPYTAQTPNGGEWTVMGIYLNASAETPEVFNRGILDPGEEIELNLRGSSPIGAGTTNQVVIATQNGFRTSWIFMGNYLPVLEANTGVTIVANENVVITPAHLQITDQDDPAESLIYTITTAPTQGSLSFNTMFTQTDIDNGLLNYTGAALSDSFEFTISDGKDSIGPYIFSITVDAAPSLTTNSGLTLIAAGSVAAFSATQLSVTDPDTLAANLVYTVTRVPNQGSLNKPDTFTQADIDNGLLIYTHTGSGSDSFEITISDGRTSIGPYPVMITVP